LLEDAHLNREVERVARMFHELLAATLDMVLLAGVLGCRLLRRTVQVRLGTNNLRLPGGRTIFMVSRDQFMKHPGYHCRLTIEGSRVKGL